MFREAKMTQTQLGIYLENIANPVSTTYNLPFLVKYSDEYSKDQVENALRLVFASHPAFYTRVVKNDLGELLLRASEEIEFEYFSVSEEEFTEKRNHLVRPFDMEGGALCRVEFWNTPTAAYFFCDVSHLIYDGTSINIFWRDLKRALMGEELQKEDYSIFDVCVEEERLRNTPEFEQAKNFYTNLLDGFDTDCKPVFDVADEEAKQEWLNYSFSLDEEQLVALKKNQGITKSAFFASALGYLTARYNFVNQSVISTIYSGRKEERTKNTVSMMVQTMPFVTDIEKHPTVMELLLEAQKNLKASRENTIYSYTDIANDLGAQNDINFAYQGKMFDFEELLPGGMTIERIYDPAHIEETKLIMELNDFGKGNYELHMGYRADCYSEEFATQWIHSFQMVCEGFLRTNEFSKISLADESAIRLLDSFNDNECAYDNTKTVIDHFRAKAKEYPSHEALVFKELRFTYQELDEITDRVAIQLHSMGIARGSVVAVLIPRCEYMAIASLGVLKAGAAYMPLDSTYPPERLNLMVEDSGASLLITTDELSSIIGENYTAMRMMIDELDSKNGTIDPQLLAQIAPKPEDLFILLYTSGSTGVPKGVMLEHGNINTFCEWTRQFEKLNETSRRIAYASYGFDANMYDTYSTLTSGACLHIIEEDIRLDLIALHKYLKDNQITHAFMTTQIGRQFAAIGELPDLKYFSTGGEKLAAMEPPKYRFVNLYGPTETTVLVTAFELDKYYKDIPIGKAINNTNLYVVDANGNRLPVGAAGELWISGPQVSRGYLNRPEKTAEVFLDNPFTDDPNYKRTYRSGDVVRFLPDGNIQFIGRRDSQVKIRGFRIELTEVEEIIRRFEQVKDVTVQAYDDPAGGKYIAAFVVALDGESVDIDALNRFILEEKPPYMVPAVTMQIEKIPYNQNQKVDKKALPKPERKVEDFVAPENETQQRIYDLLAELLGHTDFGLDTDVFMAGLSSIGAVQFNVLLSKEFDLAFSNRDIRENATVRKLEAFVSSSVSESYEEADYFKLTKTQMGIFIECMAHPGSTIYNIPLAYGLDERVDIEKLKAAVVTAINAHPYIMTQLVTDEAGNVCLKKNESVKFDASMIEVLSDEFDNVKDQLVNSYDLLSDRLFRIKLICGSRNYLFIDMHHIISDGTSLNILINDISIAYEGGDVQKEMFSGYEVSQLEEKKLAGNEYKKAKEYYDKLLTDAETDCMPSKTVSGKEETSSTLIHVAEGSADALKAFCKEKKLSMSTLFNAAFGFVLGKFTYKDDVLYTTVYNGRSDSRMMNMISMLVKTFPVRCQVEANEKTYDFLWKIQNQMMDSMINDIYSFAEISNEYNVSADLLFTYQGEMFAFDQLCGMPCEAIGLELDSAKAPMDIDVVIKGDEIHFECSYRSDLYDEEYIRNLTNSVCRAAFELTKKETMKEISLLSDAVCAKLNDFNQTDYPVKEESVNCMFERQVEAHPDQIAVISNGESLTYDELNRMANRVAHGLLSRGIQKDEIIGLISGRTKEAFIGEMAIIKSGGAFLPMVPEYPDDRIDFCLRDADSRFVLTTQTIKEEKAELFSNKPYQVLTFEELIEENTNESNPNIAIDSDALCYCIYTSGSTGTPKGVMIEHRNLRNFLDPNEKNPETANYVNYGHTILSVISISFDFSLMEVQLPLCNGLTVCMANEEDIHDPLALARLMEEHQVDVMACTPSFIGNMIDIPQVAKAISGMKLYDFGAEAFPSSLYEKLRVASPDAVICNGYGPTETTISCVSKALLSGDGITIGWPAANVKTYVCDKDMNVLPIGACGELVIGGAGVGRGYVKLPDKTAEVFVDLDGKRVYRSGDLVRLLPDGDIEFFGRLDNQVKLRGFRVELDEIENNIIAFPGVKNSKVVVRNNGSEDYLAGFFTADHSIDISELSAFLKEKLTYYMVPAVLLQLDEMPLTVNGKIDKKKLPSVEYTITREYVAPRAGLETTICEIFADILNQEKVGALDSFFEIGGTSLTATMVVIRLTNEGHKVVYKDIFEYDSPRELAAFIQGDKTMNSFSDDYHYEEIDKEIAVNTMEHVDEFELAPLGNIVLTGASGFLGIHILKEFLETQDGKVYCFIRRGKYKSSEQRLKNMMMYYHGSAMTEHFEERIVCIDGDVTDPEQLKAIDELDITTVINCAALVKHFVNDDSLDRVNVGGVKNLIDVCVKKGVRLIQISTTSVAGMLPMERLQETITESQLFMNQVIDNDYIRTKFLAERAVLEARRERGLDGIVIRVGNLMSRSSDGEFQINFITNSFMRSLKAYKQLGVFPITAMHELAEFSPIDSTAAAILKLAGIQGRFSIYHAYNSHMIYMSDVIYAMKEYGFDIQVVSTEEFLAKVKEASKDARLNEAMLGVMAYESDDENPLFPAAAENRFTSEVLYRCNFLWPITDNQYLYNVISVLDGFDFFELEDE